MRRARPADRDGRPLRGRGVGGGRGDGGRDRGGGSGGRARKEEPKTAEQLNDEMDSYWGKTAPAKEEGTRKEESARKEGGARPKGGGDGTKGRGKKGREEPKTAEQLDDDMDSYFGGKGAKGANKDGAPAPEEAAE